MPEVPPVLMSWAALLRRLNDPKTLQSIVTGRHLSLIQNDDDANPRFVPLEQYGSAGLALLRIQQEAAREGTSKLAAAPVILWRGDLLDAALTDSDAFLGTKANADSFPAACETWMLDPDGPKSRGWAELEEDASVIYNRYRRSRNAAATLLEFSMTAVRLELFSRDVLSDKMRKMPVAAEEVEAICVAAGFKPGIPDADDASATLYLRDRKSGDDYVIDLCFRVDTIWGGNSWIFAALDFLQQEFAAKERQTTKGWKPNTGKPGHAPLVNRVVLRRRTPVHGQRAEETSAREYSCQFMVSGHRRRLHTPRKSDGREVIWVKPYVKGDPDKPLRVRMKLGHVTR